MEPLTGSLTLLQQVGGGGSGISKTCGLDQLGEDLPGRGTSCTKAQRYSPWVYLSFGEHVLNPSHERLALLSWEIVYKKHTVW